jgi:hypothetical protein
MLGIAEACDSQIVASILVEIMNNNVVSSPPPIRIAQARLPARKLRTDPSLRQSNDLSQKSPYHYAAFTSPNPLRP